MAAVCEDFFTGDDLEAILDIIEADFVEESEEFNADIGALLSDIDPELTEHSLNIKASNSGIFISTITCNRFK